MIPLLPISDEIMLFVDIDDTVIDIHCANKQEVGFGYRSRGLNALIATVSTLL